MPTADYGYPLPDTENRTDLSDVEMELVGKDLEMLRKALINQMGQGFWSPNDMVPSAIVGTLGLNFSSGHANVGALGNLRHVHEPATFQVVNGVDGVTVTPSATNYFFLNRDGTWTVNTTGTNPVPGESILRASAVFDIDDATSVNATPDGVVFARGEYLRVDMQNMRQTASSVATNLALDTFNAVSDPSYRHIVNLSGLSKVRIQGRIGGSLVAATKIRTQYHLGSDIAVASGDAGWKTLADSAGSHTATLNFYSAEITIPSEARRPNVLIRCGLFSGDGAADPTIEMCVLNFYP